MKQLVTNEALWNWGSPAWIFAVAMLGVYIWACRGSLSVRALWMVAASAITVLAFVSPIGVLADGYLFSAHMIQHLLLLLAIPLCIWMAIPAGRFDSVKPWKPLRAIGRALSYPFVPWLCGLGAMWFWHVPSLCSAATESPSLGMVRTVSFLAAGLAFWWPIFSPRSEARLPPLESVVYLFSACLGCTLLGIYITFATLSVCPAFANPADRIQIVSMLYDLGLTPAADQQLGGLLMWVPPCSVYVCVIVSVMCRWYSAVPPNASRSQESSTEPPPFAVGGSQR